MSNLHFAELGNPANPCLVLLHGLAVGHSMWQPELHLFAERYHVLAPDLPGCAHSAAYGPFTLARAAIAVADLIQERCTGKVHVCGLSIGAMVAIQLSQICPEQIASLILSGAQVHGLWLMKIQRLIFACLPERWLVSSTAKITPSKDPALLATLFEEVSLTGKSGILQENREMEQMDFRPALNRIELPVLVLCGSKDRANLAAAQELGRSLAKAELRIIPEVGHIWNIEKPQLFTEVVCDFVERLK